MQDIVSVIYFYYLEGWRHYDFNHGCFVEVGKQNIANELPIGISNITAPKIGDVKKDACVNREQYHGFMKKYYRGGK